MIYEILCNGKLHYTRPEGHPDIQEALDLIDRTKRLFGVSAYEVRGGFNGSQGATSCEACEGTGIRHSQHMEPHENQ